MGGARSPRAPTQQGVYGGRDPRKHPAIRGMSLRTLGALPVSSHTDVVAHSTFHRCLRRQRRSARGGERGNLGLADLDDTRAVDEHTDAVLLFPGRADLEADVREPVLLGIEHVNPADAHERSQVPPVSRARHDLVEELVVEHALLTPLRVLLRDGGDHGVCRCVETEDRCLLRSAGSVRAGLRVAQWTRSRVCPSEGTSRSRAFVRPTAASKPGPCGHDESAGPGRTIPFQFG